MRVSQDADGSIVRGDGKVLMFSAQRFRTQIVDGGSCFLCGRSRSDTDFNGEHVIPKWLLRRHNLFQRQLNLPNELDITYGSYKIPCCVACNSWLGENLEAPISELLAQAPEKIAERVFGNDAFLFFSWICLLFTKVHLRDMQHRVHLDYRLGTDTIGYAYNWDLLHHIYCVARAPFVNATASVGVMGSIVMAAPDPDHRFEQFDFGDTTLSRTVMLRTGPVAFCVVLDDACAALKLGRDWVERVRPGVSPIQLREIHARLGFHNLLVENRPVFSTGVSKHGHVHIHAETPPEIESQEGDLEAYGAFFAMCLRNALGGDGLSAEEEVKVRSGNHTYLFNDDGSFRTNSIVFPQDA